MLGCVSVFLSRSTSSMYVAFCTTDRVFTSDSSNLRSSLASAFSSVCRLSLSMVSGS